MSERWTIDEIRHEAEAFTEPTCLYEICINTLLKKVAELDTGLTNAAEHATRLDEVIEQKDNRIAELEAERKTWDGHKVCELLRKDVAELVIQIERVKALPDEWRRAGSLMIDAERCLTDLEEALEDE